jgi:hypothetical protein
MLDSLVKLIILESSVFNLLDCNSHLGWLVHSKIDFREGSCANQMHHGVAVLWIFQCTYSLL